jgi:hypothetical protein
MNKRVIFVIVIALVVIGLGGGAWLFFGQSEPAPVVEEPVEYNGFKFPASEAEIDWENREIYESGLVPSAQGVLKELPLASTYYISLEIAPDLVSPLKGHQIIRYFNADDQPLTKIYFRLYSER